MIKMCLWFVVCGLIWFLGQKTLTVRLCSSSDFKIYKMDQLPQTFCVASRYLYNCS